ncbi:MAG: hypothetical protein WD557_16625 [Dehalococcoidia bacterium]
MLLLAAVLAGVGCGSDGNETTRPSPALPTVQAEGEDPEWDARVARMRALTESDEFQAASTRMRECLEAAGFIVEDGATILRDGTRFGAAEIARSGFQMSHAVAEYFGANEQCEEASGVSALRREAGVADEPLDATSVQRVNQHAVAFTVCMQARGWKYHDPVTHRGIIQYYPDLQSGEQDAYDLDEAECRAETTIP